jgi:uncharacterized paraquat-inducible protein A
MTDPVEPNQTNELNSGAGSVSGAGSRSCPGCQHEIKESWNSCRYCGYRLNRQRDLNTHAVGWAIVLVLFLVGLAATSQVDPLIGAGFFVLAGIPLGFTFIRAVFYRAAGSPLSGDQLQTTALRTALVVFIVVIGVPLAFLILAFVICAGMSIH